MKKTISFVSTIIPADQLKKNMKSVVQTRVKQSPSTILARCWIAR